LKSLVSSIKSLAQLVEDLLDISRISTGKLRITTSPVKFIPIIEAAIDVVRPAADAKKIKIKTDFDSTIPPILGDADRVQQVLWNLLSNAIKFSEMGGEVKVKLEDGISHARLIVSDHGQGINPEFLPHVFDRFRQADSSDVRRYGGLGLGLAFVREIVEMLGGTVKVESQGANLGSTFTVRLPLVLEAQGRGDLRPHSEVHANVDRVVGRNV